MKILAKTVSLVALTMVLAACGGGAEEAGEPAATATEDVAVPGALAEAGDAPAATEETPAPEASETATPEDEASPSPAASPSAAATPVAAAAATPPPMFAVCAACHSVDAGKNGIGPSLAGVFGAKAGHSSGFEYSQAMLDSGLTWDEATLNRYLENPRGVVPNTTMAYNGLKNEAQRKAVVDYLKGL